VQSGNGELRLRIDDLDAPRVRNEYITDIFETLDWLDINWTAGPRDAADQIVNFSQALRLPRYHSLLAQLVQTGQIFACTCSRKELLATSKDGQYTGTCRFKRIPLNAPDVAWRLITQQDIVMRFEDAFLGEMSINIYDQARNFIVRRRDGLPAYHIASLADDVDYGINTIVRGEDLLLSTAVQLYLAQQLALPSFGHSTFYHHPLIKNETGEKLSKSAGSTSMRFLRESGFTQQNFYDEFAQWKASF